MAQIIAIAVSLFLGLLPVINAGENFLHICYPQKEECPPEFNNCHKHATCYSTGLGSTECVCKEGFTGDGITCTAMVITFPSKSASDYVKVYYTKAYDVNALTTCLWLRTTTMSNEATLLTYATWNTYYEYTIVLRNSYMLVRVCNTQKRSAQPYPVDDGEWHPLCFTWSNEKGDYAFYADGKLLSNGTGLRVGYGVLNSGVWILGQKQVSFGGNLNPYYMYLGQLSNVNVWNRALTKEEVEEFSSSCSPKMEGNVRAWKDFYRSEMNGNVTLSGSPSCQ